jgi:hypothetical protein
LPCQGPTPDQPGRLRGHRSRHRSRLPSSWSTIWRLYQRRLRRRADWEQAQPLRRLPKITLPNSVSPCGPDLLLAAPSARIAVEGAGRHGRADFRGVLRHDPVLREILAYRPEPPIAARCGGVRRRRRQSGVTPAPPIAPIRGTPTPTPRRAQRWATSSLRSAGERCAGVQLSVAEHPHPPTR